MDPIVAATNAVPLQPAQPTNAPGAPEPVAQTANADAAAEGATGTEAQLTDEQLDRYKAVAASFVSQMYLTMWREAQRNSNNG